MSDGKQRSLPASLHLQEDSLFQKIDYDDPDSFSCGLKTPRKPTNIFYT